MILVLLRQSNMVFASLQEQLSTALIIVGIHSYIVNLSEIIMGTLVGINDCFTATKNNVQYMA